MNTQITLSHRKKNKQYIILHNYFVFSLQYETYYIKGEDGSPLSFVFNDVKGLETGEAGAHTQDMIRALHGYLQEGFNVRTYKNEKLTSKNKQLIPSLDMNCILKHCSSIAHFRKSVIKWSIGLLLTVFFYVYIQFESSSSMSMNAPGYRENPSLKDQTFCLVNIMAANTVSMMKQEVINKMKKIREAATELSKADCYRL